MFIVPTNLLTGLKKIKTMPNSAIWMLAVDGKFFSKENGPCGFDKREPGSVQGILNGFLAALKELQKGDELSIKTLQHIHNICLSGIRTQNSANPGVFRANPVGFEIMPGWASLDGLKNLIDQGYTVIQGVPIPGSTKCVLDTGAPLTRGNIEEHFRKKTKLFYIPPAAEEILDKLSASISKFNSVIAKLKVSKKDFNPDILLTIIAELIQNLTRTHAFRDGNNRSFVNNLLNALLVQNGFYPCIFYDPNVFEFHTLSQLVTILKEATAASEKIATEPGTTLFDFNHAASAAKLEIYTTMGSNFHLEIDRIILAIPEPAPASAEPTVLTKLYTHPAASTPLMFKPSEESVLGALPQEAITSKPVL